MGSTETFDAYYYSHACGLPYERNEHWLTFFDRIAERVITDTHPNTVLDAGCAKGFLVECFRNRGIDAYGIDISSYAIDCVHPSIKAYCSVGSITEPFSHHYDLIICIEVLEHLPRDIAEQTIANLCRHAEDIIFSSSPVDYKEITHYNVQPPEYWVNLFARNGYIHDIDYDASYITPWAMRFRYSREPLHRVVMSYERRQWLLTKENQDIRSLTDEMRHQLSAHEQTYATLQARSGSLEGQLAERERQLTEQQKTLVLARQKYEAESMQYQQTIGQLNANVNLHKRSVAELENKVLELNKQLSDAVHANQYWSNLCHEYERGKFIRLMRWLRKFPPLAKRS